MRKRELIDTYEEINGWGKRIRICTVAIVFGCAAYLVNRYLLHSSNYLLVTILIFQLIFVGVQIHAFIQFRKQSRRFWKINSEMEVTDDNSKD